MKPPIFIVGCLRSGTTLLRNLLRSAARLRIGLSPVYARTSREFVMASARRHGQ